MKAAKKSASSAQPVAESKMAALGHKIEDALREADELGYTQLGIHLQEAHDEWLALVERENGD